MHFKSLLRRDLGRPWSMSRKSLLNSCIPAIRSYLLFVPHKRISTSIRASFSSESFFSFYYAIDYVIDYEVDYEVDYLIDKIVEANY